MENWPVFAVGDRVVVSGHWPAFTGEVVRILEMRPIQLVVRRDDTGELIAVRSEFCKRLSDEKSE